MYCESAKSYWIDCLELRENVLSYSASVSTSGSTGVKRSVLGMFDDEIAALEHVALPALKAHRNALAPVFKLPYDVLVLIFEESHRGSLIDLQGQTARGDSVPRTISAIYPPGHRTASRAHLLARRTCSQVCQRWRNIVLNTSSLWKDVVVEAGPRELQMVLARAQSPRELCFIGRLTTGPYMDYTPRLDFSRASEIVLKALNKPTVMANLISSRFNAPALKKLDLACDQWVSWDSSARDHQPVPLHRLVEGSLRLQSISLRNFLITWQPFAQPLLYLTHLNVIIESGQTKHSLSRMERFVEFLDSTPALEHLRLYRCFSVGRDSLEPSSRTVELPHLRRLDLEIGVRDCLYFFDHVDFASNSRVRALIPMGATTVNEQGLTSMITKSFRRLGEVLPDSGPTGTLVLLDSENGGLQILAHSSLYTPFQNAIPRFGIGASADLDVNLCFIGRVNGEIENAFRAAYNALPPSFAHTVAVSCGSDRTWHELAEHCPRAMEIVCCHQSAAASLCGILTPSGTRRAQSVTFPELVQLTMCVGRITPDELGHTLLAALRAREKMGRPLKRLFLHSEEAGDSSVMEAMREIVEYVEEFRV
ncbi:hypothetical protein BC834DRAFT_373543 [Gloeopeniophorella convolvens]|nr:hypothetical protein BC834DRAFT_373543 [Gloeopeniophorella convolvens]